MPTPIAKKSAVKTTDVDDSDLLDRTMELDIRWLQYEKEDEPKSAAPRGNADDPTVVLDLTATEVHDLLSKKR